jgi:hypothetical protein
MRSSEKIVEQTFLQHVQTAGSALPARFDAGPGKPSQKRVDWLALRTIFKRIKNTVMRAERLTADYSRINRVFNRSLNIGLMQTGKTSE